MIPSTRAYLASSPALLYPILFLVAQKIKSDLQWFRVKSQILIHASRHSPVYILHNGQTSDFALHYRNRLPTRPSVLPVCWMSEMDQLSLASAFLL